MSKPQNIIELRDQLLEGYELVKRDPSAANTVRAMAQVAGKVIETLKLELEYAMLRKQEPFIEFLNLGGNGKVVDVLPASRKTLLIDDGSSDNNPNLEACDEGAIRIGRGLKEPFSAIDLSSRLDKSPDGTEPLQRANMWIAEWKSSKWIETCGYRQYRRAERFGNS